MNQAVALVKKDFEEAGIQQSLNQNDLIEVVAHDIYDKYVFHVDDVKKNYKALVEEYNNLLEKELTEFKMQLLNDDMIQSPTGSVDDLPGVSDDWDDTHKYDGCDYVGLQDLHVSDGEKGIVVKLSTNTSSYYLPKKQSEIKLVVKFNSKSEVTTDARKYTGKVNVVTAKQFEKKVKVTPSRFQMWKAQALLHNENIKKVLEFLPKNGVINVDRFTREARVKMNKNILSNQDKGFKEKIKQLFHIDL